MGIEPASRGPSGLARRHLGQGGRVGATELGGPPHRLRMPQCTSDNASMPLQTIPGRYSLGCRRGQASRGFSKRQDCSAVEPAYVPVGAFVCQGQFGRAV